MSKLNLNELFENVVQWGRNKGLDKVGFLPQAEYTLDETSEILKGYAQNKPDDVYDGIGDVLVTMIVGASNGNEEIIKELKDAIKLIKFAKRFEYRSLITPYSKLVLSVGDLIDDAKLELSQYEMLSNYLKCLALLQDVLVAANHEFDKEMSLHDCLSLAYEEIKDRTGSLGDDGKFHKD